jgi:hypothetical protein
MQTTIEQFISRNHKAGTVTKFELIGHKNFACFTTEKVSVTIGSNLFTLEPWQILIVEDNESCKKNASNDCLRKWRVKENGEFKRLDIDNGATSI